jgi:translation initiation factor 6
MSLTVDYAGYPHIGVFSRVINDIAVTSPTAPPDFKTALKDELNVEIVSTTIQGTSLIGLLLMGNSRGMVLSGLATNAEKEILSDYADVMLLSGS